MPALKMLLDQKKLPAWTATLFRPEHWDHAQEDEAGSANSRWKPHGEELLKKAAGRAGVVACRSAAGARTVSPMARKEISSRLPGEMGPWTPVQAFGAPPRTIAADLIGLVS
jgi:hypothetical protein